MLFKILADEDVDCRIIKKLRDRGFVVISVLEECPGISDEDVLELAWKEKALLLTEDNDFGELIFAHKEKNNGVIFLRYDCKEIQDVSASLINVLSHKDSLYEKFIVITVNKIRIRESC